MSKIVYIDGTAIMVRSCGQCPFFREGDEVFPNYCWYPDASANNNILGMRSLDKWRPMGTMIIDPTEIHPKCPLDNLYTKEENE